MDDRHARPPPLYSNSLQQEHRRPMTAERQLKRTTTSDRVERLNETNPEYEGLAPAKPGHQRFVLNDPVAFRYL